MDDDCGIVKDGEDSNSSSVDHEGQSAIPEDAVIINLNNSGNSDDRKKKVDSGYCNMCKINFYSLKNHITGFHKGKTEFRCTFCGQLFFKKSKLFLHLIRHENNKIKCFYCSNTFDDTDLLNAHLEEHGSLHIYLCDFCPKTFSVKYNLDDHSVIHSSPWKRKALECIKCDMMFDTNTGGMKKLKNHYEKVHKNKLKCIYCHKQFSKFIVFYNHCMRHQNKLPYMCEECGLKFRKNCRLKEHIVANHLNIHNYICTVCNKQFKYQSSLDAHFRQHDKTLCFTCNYCGKLFNRKVSLIDHFMEKSCSMCEKDFHCRTTFDSHFETQHKEDRMFGCDVCDKSYTFESGLKRHKTLEHPALVNNFKCSLCLYQTTTLHNLNRHRRRHHPDYKNPKKVK